MKITKPKEKYGYYCDLCGEMICKYSADFKACGGVEVYPSSGDQKDKELCHDCAKEIAEVVLDTF